MKYSKLVPSDSRGLTSRSAHNFRVKEGKKLMVENVIDEYGFEKVRSFAPQLCGHTKDNTIEKLSSSPCFNDDYRSLTMKASRYELTSKCSSTANFLHPQSVNKFCGGDKITKLLSESAYDTSLLDIRLFSVCADASMKELMQPNASSESTHLPRNKKYPSPRSINKAYLLKLVTTHLILIECRNPKCVI